jgi:hypothetical protein
MTIKGFAITLGLGAALSSASVMMRGDLRPSNDICPLLFRPYMLELVLTWSSGQYKYMSGAYTEMLRNIGCTHAHKCRYTHKYRYIHTYFACAY